MRLKGGRDGCSHAVGWIDVKSLIAGMLVVGFVAFHGNLLPDNNDLVSLTTQQLYQLFAGKSSPPSRPCNPVQDSIVSPKDFAEHDRDDFATRRVFKTHGSAAAVFVQLGAYRGGVDSFAVVGLAAKAIHAYGNAAFECEWIPAKTMPESDVWVKGKVRKLMPDGNMGRQYTVVVVNCSFPEAVGVDGKGGELVLCASRGDRAGGERASMERFVALKEKEDEYAKTKLRPPYPYDFVYCGSPLFGKIDPQRIREWIAYHAKLFGSRAHFVFYDAGGISTRVRAILQPWLELGYLTVHDVRQQARYDGYYANQVLFLNDCFHRTRFLSNWTFFFGFDEFLYVPPSLTLQGVMARFSNYTQVIFKPRIMSIDLCEAGRNHSREWGFEKLVYRNVQRNISRGRTYAIQSRNAFATGLNRSDHMIGTSFVHSLNTVLPNIRYYHFHKALTNLGDPCRQVAKATIATKDTVIYDSKRVPFRVDKRLQKLAKSVKSFERSLIGPQPSIV